MRFEKGIDDRCPKCGGEMYYLLNETLNEKLADTEHERTVYCRKCEYQDKRVFRD